MNPLKFPTHLLLASLCLVFLFSACKKDDPPAPRTSEFSVGEFDIDLSNGFINAYGENDDGSYDWDIVLASENLDSVTYVTGIGTGSASIVYLDLNSDSENGLTEGTYEWSSDRAAFTLADAYTTINYDLSTNVFEYEKEAMAGTVKVSFDGDDTIFDFTLTIVDGMELNGYYRGPLQFIE